MNNITFAQTLFSVTGLVFVAFSLIFIVLFRKAKFGILTLLLSNVFFWSAIVFPKVVISILDFIKLPSIYPSLDVKIQGAIAGVVLFIIWFVFSRILLIPFKKKPVEKSKKDENKDSNDSDNKNEESDIATFVDNEEEHTEQQTKDNTKE